MSNIAGILNGGKVSLYAEVTASNFVLIGGQTTHSLSMAMAAIEANNKNAPDDRCYLEGEGLLTADITGEMLFSNDAAYQFMLAAHQTKTFINVIERLGSEALDPTKAITVMVLSIGDNPALNSAYSTSIALSSSEEFNVIAPPAVIAGTFEGTSFSATGEDLTPWGVAKVGTDFWVTGDTNDSIFIYDSLGAYSAVTHDVSGQTLVPRGITMDNVNVWVVGSDNDAIYAYDVLGVNIPANTIDVSNEGSAPLGVAWNGYHLFVTFTGSTVVYKYIAGTGAYTGVSFDTAMNTAITAITGIEFDGKFFWVCSDNDDSIYQFDGNGVTTGFDFSVSGEDTSPQGLTSDGVNLFMLGAAGSIFTYE